MCNARSTKTTPFIIKKDQSSASSTSSSEPVHTTTAPCHQEQIEIDIGTLSAEDLQSLKQDDPFLYYSIPVVRRAAFRLEEPDMSHSNFKGSTTVKRRTRVSYECHTDLLMDDLLGDFEDEEYDESALEQIDLDFLKMLGLHARQQ